MLPAYVTGLKQRVAVEVSWLQSFLSDPEKQQSRCGMFGQATRGSCVTFAASMQRAKVQALQAALTTLSQIEAQLNSEMASKIAAFDVVSLRGFGLFFCLVAVCCFDRCFSMGLLLGVRSQSLPLSASLTIQSNKKHTTQHNTTQKNSPPSTPWGATGCARSAPTC